MPRLSVSRCQVLEVARAQFNCSTVDGAELERYGGDGTRGSHFAERLFNGELMNGWVDANTMVVSNLTLAVFEDSGWYLPDYSYAQPLRFGLAAGCGFASTDSCKASQLSTAFSQDYCSISEYSNPPTYSYYTGGVAASEALVLTCTPDRSAIGSCQGCDSTVCLQDGCYFKAG